MAHGGSKLAVVAALLGNAVVAIAKFIGFAFTGSAAMLSEAIHTLADLLNQVLLLIGIVRSGQRPDRFFEYGYSAERYVWALISAVGIFFLGCGVTVYHGVHSLVDPPHESADLSWAVGVLIFSFVIEGYILFVAVQAVRRGAGEKPFFEYLRTEADPSAVAVVLEDFAACTGVIIALVAIVLAWVTGEQYWDAIGSILVGLLLGAVAVWLIARNRNLLVGPSIPPDVRREVLEIIRAHPAVEDVVDLRTRVLDTGTYRIKADLRFDGAMIASRMETKLRSIYPEIRGYEDFKRFAARYADELVELLAEEVDGIEQEIRRRVPEARHLDLEAD